jgi:hypothetical protein
MKSGLKSTVKPSDTSKETLEEKILRMIRNEAERL